MTGNKSEVISRLSNYIKIKTVQPCPDYSSCIKFLVSLAEKFELSYQIVEPVKEKPIFIISIIGSDPSLPSVLLNSHMDVVPVSQEKWMKDPFGGEIFDGKIYGRGTQDMKGVGMAFLEAVIAIRKDGKPFTRSFHLSFVPDEEIGGEDGMKAFAQTDHFRSLNVGFVIDEGIPSPTPSLFLFNDERVPWCNRLLGISIKTSGQAGHGSALLQGTAMERMLRILQRVQNFRESQISKLANSDNALRDFGKFTSVNITMIEAGKQVNVIPDIVSASLDVRVARDFGEDGVKSLMDSWTEKVPGVSVEFVQKAPLTPATKTTNDFWVKIENCLNRLKISYSIATFPGATDARFLRQLGVPAIGFTPFRNTPPLLHDHDESLDCDVYIEGIKILIDIIKELDQ